MKIGHKEFRYHFQVQILSNAAFITLYIHKKHTYSILFPIYCPYVGYEGI
jgi:hypothetical protein